MGEFATKASRLAQVFAFVALAVAALVSCQPIETKPDDSQRILFVGNSLTYVGNLPAVVEAIGASNGKRISTEMLVAGGATLTDRLDDGSVEKLLQENRYDYVVLQERGGDLVCDVTEKGAANACDADSTFAASRHAHIALGQTIHAHRAKVILLGTYQRMPTISKEIEMNERVLAQQIGAIYIPVSERLRIAAENAPGMNWFYVDGGHPGHDLILMEAMWIFEAITGSTPNPSELRIDRTMFGPSAHLNGSIPSSKQQSESLPAKPYIYDRQRIEKIIAMGRSYL